MIRPADAAGIAAAAELLRQGGLVGLPTETVYGLAADAFNAPACARIFEVKARPTFDPLIVHLARLADLPLMVLAGMWDMFWVLWGSAPAVEAAQPPLDPNTP